jgi:hypothetical protein
MIEEEKKAIEWLKKAEFFSERLYAPVILNLIEKQQKEIEEYAKFVLDMKEKMNNFQFEAETGWRKIEKLEKKVGDKDE